MVCYGANTVSAIAGDFQTVFDGVKTVRTHTRDFQTVCECARQFSRPAAHMLEATIHSTTCQNRLGNFRTLPDSLYQCPTVSHSVENSLGISCRCPDGLCTVADCL
ncbi:hypothetical protein DPMN_078727 [Dreissena polymorpha]|uniref:Uncharacterized protein n=1 Tax=Dreissena polymorpha TaxID=45954 RepID=A0A9D3YRP5_DREPO|nr:hypothetical protein DPMN_078727 [Dreissena polymorpha]